MILAQNHRRLLNGNKIFYIFFISIFLTSCGVFSSSTTKNSDTSNVTKKSPNSKVDTVVWEKIPESIDPPITSEKNDDKTSDEKILGKKESYRIAAFIPFEINRMNFLVENPEDLRNVKYLHYYAGMKMAMEDLEKEDIKLTLDVYDSKEDKTKVDQVLKNQLSSETDVIMGTIKKELLIDIAEFGKENEIPVISPWYSSQSITKENPYYVQLNPFLTQHYTAITEHALENFEPEQIFLVGREYTKDVNRFKYFQEAAYNILEEENSLQTFEFDIDSLSSEFEIIKNMLLEDQPTVFIIPNYSKRDAQFIYDILRRINVEKMDKEVYVYGMPVMYSMDKISYEYFTNLNIRIVMSRFVDLSDNDTRNFFVRYFNEYNDFAKDEAFEGYDNMMFLGRMLDKYGTDFINKLDKDSKEYFTARFNIQPVFHDKPEENSEFDYLENKNLRIVQFIENQFTAIE